MNKDSSVNSVCSVRTLCFTNRSEPATAYHGIGALPEAFIFCQNAKLEKRLFTRIGGGHG